MRRFALVVAFTCGLASTATAQPRATLERYRPAPTAEDDFHLSRATDLGHLRFGLQLSGSYALNPLVYESVAGDSSSELFAVVEHQLVSTLGLSFGLWNRLVIYAGMAAVPMMRGSEDPVLASYAVAPADGGGLGDFYFGTRVRLVGDPADAFALAAQATMTAPTSGAPNASYYRGDATVTFLPSLIAELRPGANARVTLNLGARIREESDSADANLGFGHELTYGVGVAVPFYSDADDRTHLDGHVQLYGDTTFARFGERDGTALETIAGLRFHHANGFIAGLAGGLGLARGFGSPDLRLVLTIAYAAPHDVPAVDGDRDGDGILDSVDTCPDEPEDRDDFADADGCPDPDNDGDGILDADDECPLEPETVNQHADEDGCPDEVPDTDGDGLRDDVDRCVEEPEDADGFEDDDGCPEPDNDRDGVLDVEDRCPLEAGPATNGGCPDPDRDADTVVDRLDNCPDEPGPVENHGCREVQRVVIESGRLQILDMVFFRTNHHAILARSYPLLRNVAAVLASHPEIEHIIVEGHTDARGRREHNIRLSQRRAEAVVEFLVAAGLAPERLQARGYGPDRPQVPNARTRADHASNRRVEFHIAGEHDSVQTQTESEAPTDAIDR